jgi:3-dehydroshikimate dehydratase
VGAAGGRLAVKGVLQGPPETLVTVEVFAGRAGTTEGERYLGSIQAVTDASGKAAFAGQVDGAAAGSAITATTTTAAGASSAFSKAVAAR